MRRERYVLIEKGKSFQWHWELRAANNRTVSTSETFWRRRAAVQAARKAHPDLPVLAWIDGRLVDATQEGQESGNDQREHPRDETRGVQPEAGGGRSDETGRGPKEAPDQGTAKGEA